MMPPSQLVVRRTSCLPQDKHESRLSFDVLRPLTATRIQDNKTALMLNLASAAVDNTVAGGLAVGHLGKTGLKDGFSHVKNLAGTVTNPLGKRTASDVKGGAIGTITVSEDMAAIFEGGARLKLTDIRGEGLAKRNPYVIFRLRHESNDAGSKSRIKVKSRVKIGTTSPHWNETFEMDPVSSWGDLLKVEVRHVKTTSGEEKIGEADLELSVLRQPPHMQQVTLELRGEGSGGTITVSLAVESI